MSTESEQPEPLSEDTLVRMLSSILENVAKAISHVTAPGGDDDPECFRADVEHIRDEATWLLESLPAPTAQPETKV